MENVPKHGGADISPNVEENVLSPISSRAANIIENHDFSQELHSRHANCCSAFVVPCDASNSKEEAGKPAGKYAVVTNRKECWQGLEQDITHRVSRGSTYLVSACVGVSGPLQGSADVLATLKLEFRDSATSYLLVGRISASKESWANLEGTFSLSTMPQRVIFYLEGPSLGVDILIKSVVITCTSPKGTECGTGACITAGDDSIILNPRFVDGLNNWSGRGCKIALHDFMGDGKIVPQSGKVFASATERTQYWNGIQQEIAGRVQRKLAYEVTAVVRIFGNNVTTSDVRATLWVQTPNQREQYNGIAKQQDKDWTMLQGKFLLNGSPSRVVVYLEGPPSGTDILINSLIVKHAEKIPLSPAPVIENPAFGVNIVENSNLSNGTNGWFGLGNCTLSVGTGSPLILPPMARE